MQVSINNIKETFLHLYENIHDREFAKSLGFSTWMERDLLPLIRFYLLGRYGSVSPEVTATLTKAPSGQGRIDFVVGNTAIELAVRTPNCSPAKLLTALNENEIIKLMKYDGPSVLVLYDFSDCPLSDAQLKQYRELPSLGKGNHFKSPFSVLYYCRADGECTCVRKNIRV